MGGRAGGFADVYEDELGSTAMYVSMFSLSESSGRGKDDDRPTGNGNGQVSEGAGFRGQPCPQERLLRWVHCKKSLRTTTTTTSRQ